MSLTAEFSLANIGYDDFIGLAEDVGPDAAIFDTGFDAGGISDGLIDALADKMSLNSSPQTVQPQVTPQPSATSNFNQVATPNYKPNPNVNLNNNQTAVGAQQSNGVAQSQIQDAKEFIAQAQGPSGNNADGPQPAAEGGGNPGRTFAANTAIDAGVTAGLSMVSPEIAAGYAAMAVLQDVRLVAGLMGQGSQVTMGQGGDLERTTQRDEARRAGPSEGYQVSRAAPSTSTMQSQLDRMSRGPGFGRLPPLEMERVAIAEQSLEGTRNFPSNSPEMQAALRTLENGREAVEVYMGRVESGVTNNLDNAHEALALGVNAEDVTKPVLSGAVV